MRVLCPSCAAVYEVPEPLLGAGSRTLRCGHCGTEWVLLGTPPETATETVLAEPEGPPSAPQSASPGPEPAASEHPREPPPAAEPEAAPQGPSELAIPQREGPRARPFALGPAGSGEARPAPEASEPRQGHNGAAWLGWLVSLALIALLVWAGYAYRGAVMHAWAPSQRLYALFGLGPARP
jgi:predicted Zn finger-like uncharacterized protein